MPSWFCDDCDADADLEAKLGAEYVPFSELLRNSDFISVHIPLTGTNERVSPNPEASV